MDSTIPEEEDNAAPKSWFHPFIVRDDMIPNHIISKLNEGLFLTELERASIPSGIYDKCAKVTISNNKSISCFN